MQVMKGLYGYPIRAIGAAAVFGFLASPVLADDPEPPPPEPCDGCVNAFTARLSIVWMSTAPAQQIGAASSASAFCPGVNPDCDLAAALDPRLSVDVKTADFGFDISATGPTSASAGCGIGAGMQFYSCIGGTECELCDVNADGACDGADVGLWYSCLGSFASAGASANTSPPAFGVEILGVTLTRTGSGVAVADPKIEIQFLDGETSEANVVVSGVFSGEAGVDPIDDSGQIRKSLVVVGGSCHGVFVAECGTVGIGSELDAGTNTWQFDTETTVSAGLIELDTPLVAFVDQDFDLDGDGRFNKVDRDLLAAVIPTSSAQYVQAFDFDSDGDVDIEDLAVIDTVVAKGFGSGLFGDIDGDGFITCQDIALFNSNVGLTLCDGAYSIRADFDVDGDVDQVDIDAFNALDPSPRADLGGNGVVDGQDIAVILAVWGTDDESADFNADGIVDGQDLAFLIASWGESC